MSNIVENAPPNQQIFYIITKIKEEGHTSCILKKVNKIQESGNFFINNSEQNSETCGRQMMK